MDHKGVFILLSVLFSSCALASSSSSSSGESSPFAWHCHETKRTCSKVLPHETALPMDMMACKMTCSGQGLLWPLPTAGYALSEELAYFYDETGIALARIEAPDEAGKFVRRFYDEVFEEKYLLAMKGERPGYRTDSPRVDLSTIEVEVVVLADLAYPTLETDESYSLVLDRSSGNRFLARIEAESYYGARHAIETLSQLISWNANLGLFQFHTSATVEDGPLLAHRGISVDTSRHFIPMPKMKKIVDGLSYNKLNVFHWHISDAQSFPLELPRVPQLAHYGANTPGEVYTFAEAKDFVEYAKLRGVRVIPEFDGPRHAANGWQFGELEGYGQLAFCINQDELRCRGGVCGLLNPINPRLYELLEAMFADLLEIFPDEYFHFGGDEVVFDCWRESREIQDYFAEQGLAGGDEDYFALWAMYHDKALETLKKVAANSGKAKKALVWTSSLTRRDDALVNLPKENYTIQIWSFHDDPSIAETVNKGYDVIYSNEDFLYLGCGLGSWGDKIPDHCSPFKQWREVYDFDPIDSYLDFPNAEPERIGQIIGGELGMWNEQTYGDTIEGRIFPRAAAFAERMWTRPASFSRDPRDGRDGRVGARPLGDWKEAEIRFVNQRERIVERGVVANPVNMHWCYQNEGRCRLF